MKCIDCLYKFNCDLSSKPENCKNFMLETNDEFDYGHQTIQSQEEENLLM